MALAAVATIVVPTGHSLLGQASTSQTVIYKQCYRPPDRVHFGRFPECGIEASSGSSPPANNGFFCFRADGAQTTDRGECANVPSVPVRTPEQERAIIQRIEKQRVEEKRAARQVELMNALEHADRSVAKYADGHLITLSAAQKTVLEEHEAWLASQLKTGQQAKFTLSEMNAIAVALKQRLANARGVIKTARETLATTVAPIENIMLRIDDLVRRVGTVIGSLEKAGARVPLQVKRGYDRAKAGMTIAHRSCSPRRPQNCLVLHDVLNDIEAMRDPLCALPSDKLSFCRQ